MNELLAAYKEVMERLKNAKAQRKIAQVARHANMTLAWVSFLADGKISNPGIFSLVRLASALDEVIPRADSVPPVDGEGKTEV